MEFGRDSGEVFVAVNAEVCSFREVLPKKWNHFSRPLVLSFEPRCQGLAGLQKYTGISVCRKKLVAGHVSALIPG